MNRSSDLRLKLILGTRPWLMAMNRHSWAIYAVCLQYLARHILYINYYVILCTMVSRSTEYPSSCPHMASEGRKPQRYRYPGV